MQVIAFDRGVGLEAHLFRSSPSYMVSFVGAGGKSTLIYCLAEALASQGKKVLIATSTHIYVPRGEYYAATAEEAQGIWSQGRFSVIGTREGSKLTSPDPMLLEALKPLADVLLVEADGSKGYPIKVPRDQEPVIWRETDLVVCVMGLSALGRPWKDCCFGAAWGSEEILTEQIAAGLLSSEKAGRKAVGSRDFWVVLNQCDDAPRMASAWCMAQQLKERGVSNVLATAFDARERAHYCYLANAEA